jgi:hypothetical protein
MAIETNISIQEVISKVYRDLNLQDETRWEDMIEWSAEALEQIGAYAQYIHKTETITVAAYRAKLPCDFHKIITMSYNNQHMRYLSGSFDTYWHQADSVNLRTNNVNGYNINSSFINTNFEKGDIILAYIATPTDDDGFPLVPNNVSYKEAIFWYILMKLFLGGFTHVNPQLFNYNTAETRWHHYCSQARGKANMPSMDMMESLKNQWNRLMPNMSNHTTFHKNIGDSERLTR